MPPSSLPSPSVPSLLHILGAEGLVTIGQAQAAQAAQQAAVATLGYAPTPLAFLVDAGVLPDSDLLAWVGAQAEVGTADLRRFIPDKATRAFLKARIPAQTAFESRCIPLLREVRPGGDVLVVGMVDPRNRADMDALAFQSRFAVRAVAVSDALLTGALESLYGENPFTASQRADAAGADGATVEVDVAAYLVGLDDDIELVDDRSAAAAAADSTANDAPVIKIVNGLLSNAVARGASDIHIEPGEKDFRVRYRIDGELVLGERLPFVMKASITSRVKILSGLDIAEKRLSQDGRMKMRVGQQRFVDFRVSTLPSQWGEKLVLRLLDRGKVELDLTRFGLSPSAEQALFDAVAQPYGMILVTGPTGSGKTTTLYATLTRLNTAQVNIVTVEDPIEYNLADITQVQVRPDIGLTFPTVLRSILRQDPNIVMVGEIRDKETADTAIQAAQTGHLVLSTLHTNSAAETITRLLDMGVPGYAVAAAVRLVVAQRLVRRICQQCRVPEAVTDAMATALQLTDEERAATYYVGSGVAEYGGPCPGCRGTGYAGRTGVYEVLPVTRRVRAAILAPTVDTDAIRATATDEGLLTLRQDGIRKAALGQTTLAQVLKETVADGTA